MGECYMGVTNLEGKQASDHVKNVALFSLGVVNAVKNCLVDEDNPKYGHVHIRVGFHSGRFFDAAALYCFGGGSI